eukprot:TRINITY_DN298_c0_g1_i7.p1 TRINITY_DN298_c0_g1~~TRINITY_DN298_c0_g1_i7.p1  ORF type:complete len:396 (+),score=121.81 TRINITY_DN298_c0_g1_i7:405-1592(+)
MNPEKMRTDYGKMMYLLMDSQIEVVQENLEFKLCNKQVRTVETELAKFGLLDVLKHPKIEIATKEVTDDGTRTRVQLQAEIKEKEEAVKEIVNHYAQKKKKRSGMSYFWRYHSQPDEEEEEDDGVGMSEVALERCLYSLSDGVSYLNSNMAPIDAMISALTQNFKADAPLSPRFSLAIIAGSGGARLSHDHERQYNYVLQSLMLWKEITKNMFRLWHLAEADLLDETNPYRLTDTGQGLNRVQRAPQIGDAMHKILSSTQKKVASWVGSSVVHLGDHNVPNALMFIDKYTQVPRIINPILLTIKQIPQLMKEDEGIAEYIVKTFGSHTDLALDILTDFFRHGFDGSGADNFFDAGSCIDGRLTSAWNWCSMIGKKKYYSVFKLAGFAGFDGSWQK